MTLRTLNTETIVHSLKAGRQRALANIAARGWDWVVSRSPGGGVGGFAWMGNRPSLFPADSVLSLSPVTPPMTSHVSIYAISCLASDFRS